MTMNGAKMAYTLIVLLLVLPAIIDTADVSTTTAKPSRVGTLRTQPRNGQKQDRLPPSRKGTVEDVKERIQIRDIIKFELSDARVPSKDNPKELKSLDMDTMGSRIVQVTHPAPTPETRTRTLRELPIGVQKAISHAFKSNYNLPYLDTVKYYFKEQTPKPLYSYDVGESNKAIVAPLVTTKLKAESPNKPWWQPAKLPSVPQLTSYTVISTPSPSSTTHRPLSLLKAYPMRYTYKYAPTTSRIIQYYGDKIQPKPYIYNKPLNPISITEIQSPNVLDDFPEVTTTNSVTSTAPVLFPVTPSPFPKNRNPLESLLKFYSSEKDIHNYFQSKDTLTLVKAAVEALREQNPHLDIMPKGIENNELIVRVTPKPEYLGQSTTTEKPEFSVPDLHSHLEPNLNYLSKPSSIDDVNVVRIVPTELHTISDVPTVPKNDAYVHLNNLTPGLNTHSEYAAGYAFGYQVRDHHTGNNFRHTQRQMKDGTTHGEYKILMADGRTQNVKYKADEDGYHADVTYDI